MTNWLHSRHRWKRPITEAYTKSYNPVKEAVAVPRRKKEDMTKQASEADAEQWSSWSSWTWSPSPRSSWWDSSLSQTPRKAEWPTTSDVSATRLEHKWKNTSSGRPVAKRLRHFFQFFLNLWLDNRRVTIRTGDVRGYNLSRTLFSALLHSDAHVTHSAHWSDFNGIRSVWKIIPSSHHLVDFPWLCATDYNFPLPRPDFLYTLLVLRWYIGIIPTAHELTRSVWLDDATPPIHRCQHRNTWHQAPHNPERRLLGDNKSTLLLHSDERCPMWWHNMHWSGRSRGA